MRGSVDWKGKGKEKERKRKAKAKAKAKGVGWIGGLPEGFYQSQETFAFFLTHVDLSCKYGNF